MLIWEAKADIANGDSVTKYYPCNYPTDDEQYEVESLFISLLDNAVGAGSITWWSVNLIDE